MTEDGIRALRLSDCGGTKCDSRDCISCYPGGLGPPATEAVNHPPHYGGADNPYEAIKVIDAWGLGFSLGNAVKYISRAGRKDPAKKLEDLKKARWYLDHEIQELENAG